MSLENYIDRVNKNKKFKYIVFLILSLPSFQYFSQLQNAILATYIPKFTCVNSKNATGNQCLIESKNGTKIKCPKFNYSSKPFGSTAATEFNLVCDKENYGDILLLSWYSTSLLAPIMGLLSDRYGRKTLAIVNLIAETITTILLGVVPNYLSGFIVRFLQGLSSNGVFICFVWLMELVDEDFRTFAGSFYWFYGCVAYTTFPLIVYHTRNWRFTQLYSMIPSIFYILIFFVPESPRWLLVSGKVKETMRNLKIIQRFNGVNFEIERKNLVYKEEVEESFLKALKSKTFLIRISLAFYLELSTFIFWGAMTLVLNMVSKDEYKNIFLMGLMEFPSLILSYISLFRIKRKNCVLIYGGVGSILFFISVFFSKTHHILSIIRILFGCLAKICVATCIQTTLVFITELFPTSQRTFSIVFVQLANFLSFLLAVYINKLISVAFYLPMLIYLINFWISYLLTLFILPETKNIPIPELLSDIEYLEKGKEEEYKNYMENKNDSFFETKPLIMDSDSDDLLKN